MKRRFWLYGALLLSLSLLAISVNVRAHVIRAFLRSLDPGLSTLAAIDPVLSRNCLPTWTIYPTQDYRALITESARLDAQGVVLYDYGASFDRAGWQYFPTYIANLGMNALRAWCEQGDEQALAIALAQARWLVANADRPNGFPIWRFDFPNNAPVGWQSGLTAGTVIGFFVQLHALSGDTRYLDMANDALTTFERSLPGGGVRFTFPDGSVFYEEVADPQARAMHILNGHIVAVYGLAYFADYTGNERARRLADEGIAGVKARMAEFDAGDTTYYSLDPLVRWPVTEYAHAIHVQGLYWMYARTGDPAFKTLADRWFSMMKQ